MLLYIQVPCRTSLCRSANRGTRSCPLWRSSLQLLIHEWQAPPLKLLWVRLIITTNRTILVQFGGISGEFGWAMVCILARRSPAKIPMVRQNEPDIVPYGVRTYLGTVYGHWSKEVIHFTTSCWSTNHKFIAEFSIVNTFSWLFVNTLGPGHWRVWTTSIFVPGHG